MEAASPYLSRTSVLTTVAVDEDSRKGQYYIKRGSPVDNTVPQFTLTFELIMLFFISLLISDLGVCRATLGSHGSANYI